MQDRVYKELKPKINFGTYMEGEKGALCRFTGAGRF